MATQKRSFPRKSIIYLGIMALCLITGMDDISGFWQPLNVSVPVIQSVNGQDNGENHSIQEVFIHPAWRDAINVAQRLSFSQALIEEIKWQTRLIYLRPSHTRAPPSFS